MLEDRGFICFCVSHLRPLGILANPASGKDVRRLVARASVFDNQEKSAIVRRALLGAWHSGVSRIRYFDDSHGICRTALEEIHRTAPLDAEPVDSTQTRTTLDTISAARALEAADCGAVITLGGDGTNRAFTLGWQDAILMPLSTGTNNVFPVLAEATIAGAAAALVATGQIACTEVAERNKIIRVAIEDEDADLALIDAVVTRDRFVGARALLEPENLKMALLTRADPAAVGMTSLGGLITPMTNSDEGGFLIELGNSGDTLNAPIAPGYYQRVGISATRAIPFGESVAVKGPCVLAFDGERERVLKKGQLATFTVTREGPWVIDIPAVMAIAAERRLFANTKKH